MLGLEELKAGLSGLADKVASRLKSENLAGSTVRVQVKTPDFRQVLRQTTIAKPTNSRKLIFDTALELCLQLKADEYPVRLLGISLSNIVDKSSQQLQPEQLNLFSSDSATDSEKQAKVEEAFEKVRQKFGKGAVFFGNSFKLKKGD